MCNAFIHPDPIKQKEANIAKNFRKFFDELPQQDWIRPSDYTLPAPGKLDRLNFEELVTAFTRLHGLIPEEPELPEKLEEPEASGKRVGLKVTMIGDSYEDLFDLVTSSLDGYYKKSYIIETGTTFGVKEIKLDDSPLTTTARIQLWLLHNSPSFQNTRQTFYRGADGGIFFFNLTREESLNQVPSFIEEFSTVTKSPIRQLLGYEPQKQRGRRLKSKQIKDVAKRYNMSYHKLALKNEGQARKVLGTLYSSLVDQYLESTQ